MNKNTFVLIGIMLTVSIISVAIAHLRIAYMTAPDVLASQGLSSVKKQGYIFYGIFLPAVVGLISLYAFRYLEAHRPAGALTAYHVLAIGLGLLLTISAAVVFKMRGFTEFLVLHILYITLFGWIMPLLLTK